jgi:DNA polymerase elongation subunit (family B)
LQEIIDKKVSMDKLVISKSLRSNYKNPQQIAHNVLAQRIGKRDPGNKPNSGDRIPYVYIQTGKKALQGEKIESPQFIIENHLKIDYSFYISNQIMKPVLQIFALVLYDMKEFTRKKNGFVDKLETLQANLEPDKYEKKAEDLKNKEVKAILFDPYLRKTDNEKAGNKEITSFFK